MTGADDINLTALVPEISLALAAVLGLLLSSWIPRRRQWIIRAMAWGSVIVGTIATVFSMLGRDSVTASGTYTIDISLNAVRIAVLAATAIVIALGADHFAGDEREGEFYVLVLLGSLGTMVLAGTSDLLLLLAGYLLASIPLYALVGFAKDRSGTEAMLKYYLMGALFGVFLLFGVLLMLATGGDTVYTELGKSLPHGPMAATAVGILGVTAGLLFKAGAVPAHFWVPDAIDGATTPVAAFISTVPKIGALVALFRLSAVAWPGLPLNLSLIFAILAAMTMTLGNLAAFFQTRVRRLLAYSTISQVGYLLMVLAAVGGSSLALPSLLFYLLGYTVTNLGAFAVVSAFPSYGTLNDYTGLFRKHPWLAVSLIVLLLGLVGTPPTAVFLGKLTAFTAAFGANLGWLVVLAAANTVASVFYYLRWVFPLFQSRSTTMDRASESPRTSVAVPRVSAGLAIGLAVLSLALGLGANPVLQLLER